MAPIKWGWKRRWWSSEAEAKVEDALSAFEHRPQLPELAGKLWSIKWTLPLQCSAGTVVMGSNRRSTSRRSWRSSRTAIHCLTRSNSRLLSP
jgi:hypothetical protein